MNHDSDLVESIFKVSRCLRGKMMFSSTVANLTMLQIQVLVFLSHHKNAHMRDVAEYFGVEMPTATSIINKICDMDLVSRSHDAKDRRVIKLSLTKQGEDILAEAMKMRTKKISSLLSYLSVSEKDNLKMILTNLAQKLEGKR